MGRSHSNALRLVVAILCLWSINGCGKKTTGAGPIFPGRVNLIPTSNTSLAVGATFSFAASVQSAAGQNINTVVSYSSSDTSILTLAPNGVACAGHWDVAFTTCTGGSTGVVQVTASALGAASVPTYVFVHPPIDYITVTGVVLDGVVPVQEPCLSQSQTMTVEAHAFSQGTDITQSVGPFTFSANNQTVVTLAPITNIAYNFATNQATATAQFPGIAQIYATAGGVSSSSFLQPQYQNAQGTTSPPLDFFSTCPIQSIALELGSGVQQSNQTTFVTGKGNTQTVTAILTDLMGYSSLPSVSGRIVLSRIPLTWSASQPGVLATPAGCVQSCVLSTPSPGSGSVTASCSPPTCNIGFPVIPASLATPTLVASCTQFFGINCQELIPVPVYAETAISGLITGTTTPPTVLATSTGCSAVAPVTCSTAVYEFSTAKNSTGPENPLPVSPNSLQFDLAGDKAYLGSQFGAQLINPANYGSSNNPYTALNTVTGNVLASSNNGTVAVFSDTVTTPNQVYVVNSSNANAVSSTALNISSAVAAAFSPDGLKTFIFGNGGSSLYVYSTLQALQGPIALSGPANANTVAFSPNAAFALVAEAAANGNSANLTAFNTCNNLVSASPTLVPAVLSLPANPLFMQVLPGDHIEGTDSYGFSIPDGTHVLVLDATGFDIATATTSAPPAGSLCPLTLTFISNDPLRPAQRVELGQGNLQPVNFFVSADASQLYIAAAGNASILVYDFGAGAVTSGIELVGNATPISAGISVDGGTIVVGGSDGLLHVVSTAVGGSDQIQLTFPSLPNYLNPFCTATPTAGPCSLNLVAVRP